MKTIAISTAGDQQIIYEAVVVLRSGGLIVYPTETVYGLGVDATNQDAVSKLLKFKGQRGRKPILIAVSGQSMAEEYVNLNDVARRLYRTFLPGPVAVVSRMKNTQNDKITNIQKRKYLARGIASIDSTVGIRIPAYPLVLKIITAFGKPITSTSANVSGTRNPWSINDIIETTPKNKLELIDLLLDAGPLPKRPPSTIVDTSREETEIVREGEIALQVLQNKDLRFKIYEEYKSQSEEETKQIAEKLIDSIIHKSTFLNHRSGLIVALQGPLGAGKTVFAKGVARALGIAGPIRSPSYTLVREYDWRQATGLRLFEPEGSAEPERPEDSAPRGGRRQRKFFHIDAWRLSDPSEFQDLGLDRMLKPGNIIVIEWIERLVPLLLNLQKRVRVIFVNISEVSDQERQINITM